MAVAISVRLRLKVFAAGLLGALGIGVGILDQRVFADDFGYFIHPLQLLRPVRTAPWERTSSFRPQLQPYPQILKNLCIGSNFLLHVSP